MGLRVPFALVPFGFNSPIKFIIYKTDVTMLAVKIDKKESTRFKVKCRCCSASYVGQNTRHFHTTVPEHLGISPITGKRSFSPVMCSIFSRLNSTGHSSNFDDFEIPSSCSDTCELIIHESLLISKVKPSPNVPSSLNRSTFYNSLLLCLFCPPVCMIVLCTILYSVILHHP